MHTPTALVTGASAGIGLAIARTLARRGYGLVLVARRRETLETLARELASAHSVRVHVLAADLSDPDAPHALMRDLSTLGVTVDVLVNNAGFGAFGLFTETDLATERRMIEVNVTALVTLSKLCLPGMLARKRGRILNVASTAGFLPGPHMSVYYATKAFVISFSEALAEELRHTDITVTVLCPGPTVSEFQAVAQMEKSRLVRSAMMTAASVADAGVDGMLAGRRMVVPGARNKIVPWLARLMPRGVVTTVSRRAAEQTREIRG